MGEGFIASSQAVGPTMNTSSTVYYYPLNDASQASTTPTNWLGDYTGATFSAPMSSSSNYFEFQATGIYSLHVGFDVLAGPSTNSDSQYVIVRLILNGSLLKVFQFYYNTSTAGTDTASYALTIPYQFTAGDQLYVSYGVAFDSSSGVNPPITIIAGLVSAVKISNVYNQTNPPP